MKGDGSYHLDWATRGYLDRTSESLYVEAKKVIY